MHQSGVSLHTIGGGVLPELFEAELARILANITDPNTDAKKKRSLTITLDFAPSKDRDLADVDIRVGSKLAGISSFSARVFVGKAAGKLVAVESNPRQDGLFDAPRQAAAGGGSNVTSISGRE